MSACMPCVPRSILNGLLTSLAIFLLVACSPSGENPSPLDIQKGPSSPYDVEANWICVKEADQRRACPQQILRANSDKEIWYGYTNVGLATIPAHAILAIVRINGMIVAQARYHRSVEPGRPVVYGHTTPSHFRRADKGPGAYEVMLELKFSEKFEEANTDNNVAVQIVEVRD